VELTGHVEVFRLAPIVSLLPYSTVWVREFVRTFRRNLLTLLSWKVNFVRSNADWLSDMQTVSVLV
jgi:hypothetical protein